MTICIGFLFRSCYLFYSKEEHWYFIIAAVVSTARLYPLTSLKNSSRLWAYLELGRHVLLSLRAPKAFPKSLFVQDSISIKFNVKYCIVLKLKAWIWFEQGPFSCFFNLQEGMLLLLQLIILRNGIWELTENTKLNTLQFVKSRQSNETADRKLSYLSWKLFSWGCYWSWF